MAISLAVSTMCCCSTLRLQPRGTASTWTMTRPTWQGHTATKTQEAGEPWRGIDPGRVGRHWNTPTQGGMNNFIIREGLIPGWPDAYLNVHDRLDALDMAGLIAWPKKGQGTPSLKRYLESTAGTAVEDV